jgi:hypothetical protein
MTFKTHLFLYFGIICHFYSYSQSKLNLGTYLTKDKLAYITFFQNNTFGYVSYKKTSPFLESQKKGSRVRGFMINELGAGSYYYEGKNIILKFTETKSAIDSVNIESELNLKDSISISIFPIYNRGLMGKPEIQISDENRIVDIGTSENISLEFSKKEFPLSLMVNYKFELKFNNPSNYFVKIYINKFRVMNNLNLNSKKFKLKHLKYIE